MRPASRAETPLSGQYVSNKGLATAMTVASCYMLPNLPSALSGLADLAVDLRWSWNHAHDGLWEQIEPMLWQNTRNPWLMLQSLREDRLRELAHDTGFTKLLGALVEQHRAELGKPTWFQGAYPKAPFSLVAYFSMEFGLSEALPIYSGGLGMLAGDALKTASDLGVPLVGVGILWQQGYFRQTLDESGLQIEQYPYNDPTQLPVSPALDSEGEWIRIELPFPGRTLFLRAWQVQIGRITLYLLDSNDPFNTPADRGITGELYGGGPETRLQQELCLGIGGWRLLEQLKLSPDLCHLNEGHAAFAILARAQTYRHHHQTDMNTALAATRAGNIFTTHTPVAAGFDRFAPDLIARYIHSAPALFGADTNEILPLGRVVPTDPNEPFNMAWLAIHGSSIVNGVSQLHGAVSRQLFQPLFPRWPQSEVPVGHVTNGVHMPSWDSRQADELWTSYCGKLRWLGALDTIEPDLRKVPDTELWTLRTKARADLVTFARQRLKKRLAMAQVPAEQIRRADSALDPQRFTMGFARRFTSYKRPNLLLQDPDRLHRLLINRQRPAQLILAGKAHPADEPGKAMIKEWTLFIQSHPELSQHIVFLDDYDMLVAEHMVQGVDLWINTPRRPWEASGTSGMKVLVNGGINVSELDGWWAEAYQPAVGWALGDRQEHDEDPAWDRQEAERLYALLEQEIIPDFYDRREGDYCPHNWMNRIRESMARLTPRFSSNRMLREYVEKLYEPAARLFVSRQNPDTLHAIVTWCAYLDQHWESIHFGPFRCDPSATDLRFSCVVHLGALSIEHIKVQLYAEGQDGGPPDIHTMEPTDRATEASGEYVYTVTVPAKRRPTDYTPRVIPFRKDVFIPMECAHIHWYR